MANVSKTVETPNPHEHFMQYAELRAEYAVLAFLLSVLIMAPASLSRYSGSGEVGNAILVARGVIEKRILSITAWMERSPADAEQTLAFLKAPPLTDQHQ